ncbi:SusC/RagA family TonB-linked outer membrane protein [Rufibacter quisquiliarum]|uniref:SusC/RagA family TonB-linked outer membrane protein n=1 Tax=Rufibacter quisquiliarum TaxID=1549639 RepID=UPI0015FA3FE9|nr:TonB-dependent receptor [Rufibacter quisquiliarum]
MNECLPKRKLVLLVLVFSWLCLLSPQLICAQSAGKVISGRVTDEKKEPLPGVSISIKGTTLGTLTDIDGKFTLSVPENGGTLVFSYLGFEPREIPVGDQTTLLVNLQPQASELTEVVVVGYGEQKKASVVGSISQTRGEDLLKTGSVTTISEALQGQMPGVMVMNSNGKPGSDAAEILIRGKSSWVSSRPLTLVDGVERDINDVDVNEIENVSVLKDASATAVYGVRGANGVILVTTKRGKTGKPKISFSTNFGIKEPTAKVKYADYLTTMEMYNEAVINDKSWELVIPESEREAWRQNISNAGPYNQYFPQINWWDELVKDYGYQQQYNLNVSGGTEFVRYFTSLGYLNDGDIYRTQKREDYDPSFRYERYNWRSNLDFTLTKSTQFSVGLSGKFGYRNQPGYRIDGGGENGFGQEEFMEKIYSSPNNLFPLKYADGEWGDSKAGGHNMLVQLNEGGQRMYKYYEGFYDASLSQDLDVITKGLSVKGKIAYTSASNYQSDILRGFGKDFDIIRYYRQYDYSKPVEGANGNVSYPVVAQNRWPDDLTQTDVLIASYDNIYGYRQKLYYEFSFNYARKFGQHDVTGLILMNRQFDISNGISSAVQFPKYREDWVGRVTYGFKNRYLLEANGAYTGSEQFAKGKRFGFFPSLSVGWVLSEEKIIHEFASDVLNFLKVRYSFGQVGSDILTGDRFTYIQIYDTRGNLPLGYQNRTVYGPIYTEGRAANPNATWETGTKQNLGIDMDLWNRLNATVDIYSEKRTDMLMIRNTVPSWFGVAAPSANIGETKSRGYELAIGWKDKIGSEFSYRIGVNFSHNENRIVFRDGARDTPEYQKQEGKPIGGDFRVQTAGYYTSLDDIYNYGAVSLGTVQGNLVPGDFMYIDFNADGRIDNLDRVAMEKTNYPWTTYGMNLGFSFKNFDVNVLFYGVTDVGKQIPGQLLWDFNGNFVSGQPNIANRWTAANAVNAQKPALHFSNKNHSQTSSSYSYVSGDYLRLKNAEIAYRIPTSYLKRIGISGLQVYANGTNLLTFTDLDERIDPETSSAGVYPLVRRFNLGFRVSF